MSEADDQNMARRDVIRGMGAALATAAALSPTLTAASASTQSAEPPSADTQRRQYWTAEYWAPKGDVRLYLYRKRTSAPVKGGAQLPVLLLVHGSSISGR